MQDVYTAKVRSAWTLHEACGELSLEEALECFVFFSSAAVYGNRGQSCYAAANMCLDALAQYRRSSGLCGVSVQWGPWEEQGMAAVMMSKLGHKGINNDVGLRVLEDVIQQNMSNTGDILCLKLPPECDGRAVVDLFDLATKQQDSEDGASRPPPESDLVTNSAENRVELDVRAAVLSAASELLPAAEFDVLQNTASLDVPLLELGMDSLSAIQFHQHLQRIIGVTIPATVIFDFPTLCEVINYVETLVSTKNKSETAALPTSSVVVAAVQGQNVKVVGVACKCPGASNDPMSFWSVLLSGCSCAETIPLSRFDIESVYSEDESCLNCSYVRQASFCSDIYMFDNVFFGISSSEAKGMDPQQRLVLEVGYEAMAHAKLNKHDVNGSDCGVFVGCCNYEWASILQMNYDEEPAIGLGAVQCMLANRFAYTLGLVGPSMTIDTACSSSLVALDAAYVYLDNNKTSAAVVAGVNVLLVAGVFVACCQARMLAADGRCKTFDAQANGYGRGEGAGAVLLESGGNSQSRNSNELAVIKGSAVRHGGRSASLTAPNGTTQQRLLRDALQRGLVDPADVVMVETHGTGTALGDPIEVGALRTVYGVNRAPRNPLILGAVKTITGHLEGAAGILGIVKTICCMAHMTASPNCGPVELNPYLDFSNFEVLLPVKKLKFSQVTACPMPLVSVSSFGFGGTIAHAVLECATVSASDSGHELLAIAHSWSHSFFGNNKVSHQSVPPVPSNVPQNKKRDVADDSTQLQMDIHSAVLSAASDVFIFDHPISPDAPLLDLGMDSLSAVQFRQELQIQIGVNIPATAIYDMPTLSAVIKYVEMVVGKQETIGDNGSSQMPLNCDQSSTRDVRLRHRLSESDLWRSTQRLCGSVVLLGSLMKQGIINLTRSVLTSLGQLSCGRRRSSSR
eukprot:GHVQ01021995.1.p1 GENE.GHVQ01021995.1~~GHVQ01021995.1.p1  ORF type:complete len:1059 (-),score=121.90 GHVQ01021995.1:218-2953(-)